MTPQEANEVLDVLRKSDDQAQVRLVKGMESHLDFSDRQIAQIAALKNLETTDDTAELLNALSAVNAAGEEENPT